jgi:hypothetical protein
MPQHLIRRGRVAAAIAAAVSAVAFTAAPANAVVWTVEYDASGTSTIASTGSQVALGPATLTIDADSAGGPVTGTLPLPGTRTQFKLAGFIPVSADVSFEVAEPLTGEIVRVGRERQIRTSASYYLKLSNVKAVGLPLFAGPWCRTKEPITINAASPEGEYFAIASGGRLTGEFSIGKFEHCGLNTLLINSIIPGDGNTVDLTVENGRRIG